jgi:hypothetical protein
MNWWIFAMACVFAITETGHFGNNFLPHSDAEFICDGITLILVALSIRDKQTDRRTPEQPE